MINCTIEPVLDNRKTCLEAWLSMLFPNKPLIVKPVAGDASFRRYFRVFVDQKSYIAMDAPPEKEDCAPFIKLVRAFENSPVRFPSLYFSDLTQGFLLLSDFGDQQLLPLLSVGTVNALYAQSIETLIDMQKAGEKIKLPAFDDVLYWREFDLFLEWYLKRNLQKNVSASDEKKLRAQYELLITSAKSQPVVFVHRDYHARNLMRCDDGVLGILDFQDAVRGPITYDLVSLLRDCYIDWPREKTEKWAFDFYEKSNIPTDFQVFLRWFDWMGLQRHLKCVGIFSRLNFRDGKSSYLKDIPRVLNYAKMVCERYPELAFLKNFMQGE